MIHIGVNTSKFAVVTESIWRQFVRKLKHFFSGRCRASVFYCSSNGVAEENCPGLQHSTRGSVQHEEGVRCLSQRRLYCPERRWHERRCDGSNGGSAGWCLTSSLLLAPAVVRLATSSQVPAPNKEITLHSVSGDRKESSDTMLTDLRCWDLPRPVLTPTHSTTGRFPETHDSGRERQHHSSVQQSCTVLRNLTVLLAF